MVTTAGAVFLISGASETSVAGATSAADWVEACPMGSSRATIPPMTAATSKAMTSGKKESAGERLRGSAMRLKYPKLPLCSGNATLTQGDGVPKRPP